MAVVRITDGLIQSVTHNVKNTMRASIEAAKAKRPDIGQACFHRAMAGIAEKIAECPKEWFKKCDAVYITAHEKSKAKYHERYDLKPDQWVPIGYEPNVNFRMRTMHDGDVELMLSGAVMWASERAAMEAWVGEVTAAETASAAAVDAARETLRSFTTLAPALKAWPALWDLLPISAKDKHREVVERRGKQDEVDVSKHLEQLGTVTAKLVASKMKV